VAASGTSGEFGPAAALTFLVEPHLWQTGWFISEAALAAVALAPVAHLARTGALRRREAVLSARVAEEMRKVKVLSGLVPTCAWCKRIRDQHGSWRRFEAYVSATPTYRSPTACAPTAWPGQATARSRSSRPHPLRAAVATASESGTFWMRHFSAVHTLKASVPATRASPVAGGAYGSSSVAEQTSLPPPAQGAVRVGRSATRALGKRAVEPGEGTKAMGYSRFT
jgi:hypothetical protein